MQIFRFFPCNSLTGGIIHFEYFPESYIQVLASIILLPHLHPRLLLHFDLIEHFSQMDLMSENPRRMRQFYNYFQIRDAVRPDRKFLPNQILYGSRRTY